MLNTENPLLLHLNKKTGPKKVVSVIAEILFFGNEIYATKENDDSTFQDTFHNPIIKVIKILTVSFTVVMN